MSSEIKPDAIRIDARGVKINSAVLNIESGGRLFQFVLDPTLRNKTTFHAGLFINLEVKSDDALKYPFEQRFCALFESPINACYSDIELLQQRFSVILTHQDHLYRQGEPFLPLLFGTNWLGVWTDSDASRFLDQHPVKTKNVSFLGSIQHVQEGAYLFRQQIAEFAVSKSEIDCFGKGIREITGKWEALGEYRFSIAMENAASDFYFSEKLVDCLLAETIPVYYGCPGIGDLLDQRGLLPFSSLDELADILDGLNEDLYEQMRPFMLNNKRKIIEQGWHSHIGLFQRLAAQLPDVIAEFSPVTAGQPSRRSGMVSRLRSFFQ